MKKTPTLVTTLVLALTLTLVAGLGVQLPRGAAHARDPDPEPSGQQIAGPQALVGTAFTYQGWLTDGGSPADGEYDLRFRLYDAAAGGNLLGAVTVPDHQVTAGLFTVQLDFGNAAGGSAFTGTSRYLEIRVRPGDSTDAYTPLSPRQELTPAPYALALPGLWTQQNIYSPNIIGGFSGNFVAPGAAGATIGGGGQGGWPNQVLASFSTIGGGYANDIGEDSGGATIGGGFDNNMGQECWYATIGGGDDNNIGDYSYNATIGGGDDNLISGTAKYATIPGGSENEAWGDYSFAAGRRAKALHKGSFVLADSADADWPSVREDALRVRFSGGATFQVNNGYWVRFWMNEGPTPAHLIDTNAGGDPGAHLTIGGNWTNASDRNAKENFAPVDTQAILDRVAAMPLQTWNYRAEGPSVHRIGPTAQDFYAAFGLGEDDLHISTVDADGVALAAIQGLYAQNQELAAEISAYKAENEALRGKVDTMEARLAALERGGVSPSVALGLPTWLLLSGLVLIGGVVLQRRRA